MSATSEEILRVLSKADRPLTGREIYDAGNFGDITLTQVTLHDLSTKGIPRIRRIKPENGKFQYTKLDDADVRVPAEKDKPRQPVVVDIPSLIPLARKPAVDVAPKAQHSPRNDTPYASVLADLRMKRDKLDAAIKAIEALA